MPFINEMKQLEKRIMMNVQGYQCLIIASLSNVTANLPQGNDLAGVKRHSAIRGCHDQFKEISVALPITKRKELTTKYGLHLQPPILDRLKRERHLQCPHDVYHLMAGKVLRFIKITIDALSSEGKLEFIKFWKSFEYPRTWQKLPNPISHIDSFMISDCLYLAMMITFVLSRFLKPSSFRNPELTLFQKQTDISRSDLAIKLWLKCWVLTAKSMTISFKQSFTEDDYIKLHECLNNERKILSQI
ncbi:serine/threonine protein kinase [Gigaspora margarita]|uniref:Serine/threonine protein kinase n=1 Tax=Gigaspora margarita TaxID=4874 RepID=A0A8H4A273_GIGMA|nr:serine/threonine protein kinase [Gigaspora margarita]